MIPAFLLSLKLPRKPISLLFHNRKLINSPAPSLYKVLGTHQRSKKHEIRGQYGENSYVLVILKKGCFCTEKSAILEKKKRGWYFLLRNIRSYKILMILINKKRDARIFKA